MILYFFPPINLLAFFLYFTSNPNCSNILHSLQIFITELAYTD